MDKAENYFSIVRGAITKASSVQEIISIYVSDTDSRLQKEFARQLMKRMNFLYHGRLDKVRAHFIKQVNTDEHTYYETLMESI
jgi:hypothetical protein